MSKEQRHKYEYQVDPNAQTAAAKVIRMVGRNKRVLEVGAGPGSITRLLKEHNNCRIAAIELDDQAFEKLSPFCERVYQCDLNNLGWTSEVAEEGKFQVVVAADVLEHLYDPWAALGAIREVLSEDGYVVVSLPHIGHNAVIACLSEEDFAYQEWGLLDRTHIRFFGIRNIQRLFNEAGFKIVEAEFVVKPPEQTEFADRWRRAPGKLKRSLADNRFGMVYQVVVKAKPDSAPEEGVHLLSLQVPKALPAIPPGAPLKRRLVLHLKALLLPYMSLETRTKLGKFLHRLGIKV